MEFVYLLAKIVGGFIVVYFTISIFVFIIIFCTTLFAMVSGFLEAVIPILSSILFFSLYGFLSAYYIHLIQEVTDGGALWWFLVIMVLFILAMIIKYTEHSLAIEKAKLQQERPDIHINDILIKQSRHIYGFSNTVFQTQMTLVALRSSSFLIPSFITFLIFPSLTNYLYGDDLYMWELLELFKDIL